MDKKLYILLVAALLIFSACTERHIGLDPAPGSSNSYIFFEPKVYVPVDSKASLIEDSLPTEEGSAFGVMGYAGTNTASIFADGGIARVYWNGTVFKYDNLAIWHGNETEHTFYAYYPYSLTSVNQNNGNPYILYTQPTSESAMQEVLTASASTKKTSNLTVPLEFHHRLWALDVVVKNSQTTGVDADNNVTSTPTITVTGIDVTVKNFPTSASIYLNGTDLVLTRDSNGNLLKNNSNVYSLPIADEDAMNIIATGAQNTYGSLLFLPVPANIFTYQITVKYLDSTGKSAEFTSTEKTSSIAFEAGKKYTLTVNKTNDQFVMGEYYDPDGNSSNFQPSDWYNVSFEHTFN